MQSGISADQEIEVEKILPLPVLSMRLRNDCSQQRWRSICPSALLHLFEAEAFTPWRWLLSIGTEEKCALHGCSDGTADEAIEPMVVGLLGSWFPFIDGPTATFGSNKIFRRDLLGEHPMRFGMVTE